MKAILALVFTILMTGSVLAQDNVKVSAGFVNSEFRIDPTAQVENLQGFYVEADGKIFSRDIFRLGGVFNFQRAGVDQDTPIDKYSFGPQLSVKAGPVEPFVGALFGFQTTYNDDQIFTRTYRVGVDVPLGRIFVRPFFTEWERAETGIGAPGTITTQRYGAGAGFRF